MGSHCAAVNTEPLAQLNEGRAFPIQGHQLVDLRGRRKVWAIPTARTIRPRESTTDGSKGRQERLYTPRDLRDTTVLNAE